MPEQIFSVHIDVYYGLNFFQKALANIRSQTYQNLEIIISDNGSSIDIQRYIQNQSRLDNRIKVINYKNNIFDFNDPELRTFIICNDALDRAKGEFFFYQSYDDLMALDYIEKMAQLFYEDKDCMSAAGLPISIYGDDRIAEEELINRKTNLRPRMMDGHELVLDYIKNRTFYTRATVFSAPGTIFSFRTKFLRDKGGFHRAVEDAQLFGMVPFGKTGFDETALFYWRRGPFQLNKILDSHGFAGVRELYDLLDDFDLYKRWLEFEKVNAKRVIKFCKKAVCEDAAYKFLTNMAELRFKGTLSGLRAVYLKGYFWMAFPRIFWGRKKMFIYTFYESLKKNLYIKNDQT